MKPHELIAHLVRATNKPTLQVATEMASASFQGTLHKFISGNVESPSRRTASRIAAYFKIDIEAIYSEAVATKVADDLGLQTHGGRTTLVLRSPNVGQYRVGGGAASSSGRVLAPELEARILQLDRHQLKGLETVVRGYLDGVAPARSAKKAS